MADAADLDITKLPERYFTFTAIKTIAPHIIIDTFITIIVVQNIVKLVAKFSLSTSGFSLIFLLAVFLF